jgi:hypothetical protein
MIYRFLATALIAGVALCSAANATEVKRKAEVRGDKEKVWAVIGDWCAISSWHPAIAKCEESSAGGKKVRTLTLKDGALIKETQLTSTPLGYTYSIDESPLPVANYTASFSVEADDDDEDETAVVWTAKFDPKGASEADAKKVIEGIFKDGLTAIAKKTK